LVDDLDLGGRPRGRFSPPVGLNEIAFVGISTVRDVAWIGSDIDGRSRVGTAVSFTALVVVFLVAFFGCVFCVVTI
jgi:hypothetical protein